MYTPYNSIIAVNFMGIIIKFLYINICVNLFWKTAQHTEYNLYRKIFNGF